MKQIKRKALAEVCAEATFKKKASLKINKFVMTNRIEMTYQYDF